MNYQSLIDNLRGKFAGEISHDVRLSDLTSWQIGGPADLFICPDNADSLAVTLHAITDAGARWMILGNGTNILFSDLGYRGVIIKLGKSFSFLKTTETRILTGAAATIRQTCSEAILKGLSGFERLAGIPGTIGAAVAMNAGAYGDNILDLTSRISYLNSAFNVSEMTSPSSQYRCRILTKNEIVLCAEFQLSQSEPLSVQNATKLYLEKRAATQPLADRSAGCTFKNPTGEGAGRLIDSLGLKGFRIGQASISQKHANFIINEGGASSSEIIRIIRHAHRCVLQKYGVNLELEILIIDQFGSDVDLEDNP